MPEKDTTLRHLKNLLLATFFTLGVLLSVAFYGLLQVEKEMKANLTEHLQVTLRSIHRRRWRRFVMSGICCLFGNSPSSTH